MGDVTTTSENFSGRESSAGPALLSLRSGSAGVVIHANIEGESDFALETRELALRLADSAFPTQIAPLHQQLPRSSSAGRNKRSKDLQRLTHEHLDLAKSVLYQSGAPTNWNLDFYGRCRVGRAAFGTDRIPDGWAERCKAVDELWLPSEFHRETFAACGVERSKILVLRPAVDSEVFRPGRPSLRLPDVPDRSFEFTAIADGMLSSGIDLLVRAFIEEFDADEDVSLVLHCPPTQCGDSHIDFEAEVIALIETKLERKLEDVPVIALLVGSISAEERASLFAGSQAFVQPARASTIGQHCLEAMACELPVIATDWGPLNDFLTEGNSFPLTSNKLVLAQPEENELVAGHRWAEPDVDHLRRQMREVFTHPKEAARRARLGRREVLEKFEWSAVLPEWIRNFGRLLD